MWSFIACLMTILCTTCATPFPQNELGSQFVALGGSATDGTGTKDTGITGIGTSGFTNNYISSFGNVGTGGTGNNDIGNFGISVIGTNAPSSPDNSDSSGDVSFLALNAHSQKTQPKAPPCERVLIKSYVVLRYCQDEAIQWQKNTVDCQKLVGMKFPECNIPPISADNVILEGGLGNKGGDGECLTLEQERVRYITAAQKLERLVEPLRKCQDPLDNLHLPQEECIPPGDLRERFFFQMEL